jgi:sugar/nucleoside kinase (ribokinase family)
MGDVMMDVTAVIDSDIAYASDTPAHVSLQPGGVAANTAAWMATRGSAATLVGAVGTDPFGQSIRRQLSELGVDVHLQDSDEPTGTCVVIVDRRRERTMFPDSGATATLNAGVIADLVGPGDHVHLSGYTFLNPATRDVGSRALGHATAAGASRSLDPASAAPLRANRDLVLGLLPQIDVLLANEDEAAVLSGHEDPRAALDTLADLVSCVVIKLGARGVIARDPSGTYTAPARILEVVDTTGAGDAFTAGFLPLWLAEAPLADAVDEGQRVASIAVGRVGASPLVG